MLAKVNDLGGKVVSVTTDGFITDKPLQEESLTKVSNLEKEALTKFSDLEKDKLYGFNEAGDIVSQEFLEDGKLGKTRVECGLKSP